MTSFRFVEQLETATSCKLSSSKLRILTGTHTVHVQYTVCVLYTLCTVYVYIYILYMCIYIYCICVYRYCICMWCILNVTGDGDGDGDDALSFCRTQNFRSDLQILDV